MFKKKTVRQKLKDARNDGIRIGLNREAQRHRKTVRDITDNHQKEIKSLKQELVRRLNETAKRETKAEQTRQYWEEAVKNVDLKMQEIMAYEKRTDRLMDDMLKIVGQIVADRKDVEEMSKELYAETKKTLGKVRYIV